MERWCRRNRMEDMGWMETEAAATAVKAVEMTRIKLATEFMVVEKKAADMTETMVAVTETIVTKSTTKFMAVEMRAAEFMATKMEALLTARDMEVARLMSVKTKIRSGEATEMLASKLMSTARKDTEDMAAQISTQMNSMGMERTGG